MARSLSPVCVGFIVSVVHVVPASQPLQRFRRLIIKAGENWQEWAGGRPEQVFAPSLGAPKFLWELGRSVNLVIQYSYHSLQWSSRQAALLRRRGPRFEPGQG